MVDEATGHIDQPGAPSKSNAAVINGIQNVTYNANGHRVQQTLHGDAERINTSLAPFLGSIGTRLKVSYPGQHAHRAERTTQTFDHQRSRAVCSHLPYILPPKTTLLLKQSVGETLNNSVCKASAPLTRNEALNDGFKLRRASIGFGRCAMVTQPIDKRITISKQTRQPIKLVPHIELGVSMGLIPGTD